MENANHSLAKELKKGKFSLELSVFYIIKCDKLSFSIKFFFFCFLNRCAKGAV